MQTIDKTSDVTPKTNPEMSNEEKLKLVYDFLRETGVENEKLFYIMQKNLDLNQKIIGLLGEKDMEINALRGRVERLEAEVRKLRSKRT